jgi:hypothetical protein
VFHPPRHALESAAPRAPVGVPDIGAFECGNTGAPTTPPTTPPSSSPVTLYPLADAFARNGIHAGTNFGSATTLDVKTDTEPNLTRDAYLRFDLGALASASSARFRVHAALSANDTVAATLYPAIGSWSETTLTWSNRPGYVVRPLGLLTVTSTAASWKEIDVTAHVKGELASGRKQIDLALHANSPSVEKLILSAREAAANRPELVVAP